MSISSLAEGLSEDANLQLSFTGAVMNPFVRDEESTLQLNDPRGLLEGKTCVIQSQKSGIMKYKQSEKNLVESYISEESRQETKSFSESPISRCVEEDRSRSVRQIQGLQELKSDVRRFVTGINHDDGVGFFNALDLSTTKRYQEVNGTSPTAAEHKERVQQALIEASQRLMEVDEEDKKTIKYEYDGMCYESGNRELVQRKSPFEAGPDIMI